MEIKYYTKGTLSFKLNPESDVGLYIGDSLVKILGHTSIMDKFKIEFKDGYQFITDMVTPVDLYIGRYLVDKKCDKLFIVKNKEVGGSVYFRLRSCNNGNKTLTIKKSLNKNHKTLYIDESGEWFIPPRYNFVLGYID